MDGRQKILAELREIIEVPLKHPEFYEAMGVKPEKAILFYGLAGIGKTYLVKELADQADAKCYYVNLGEVDEETILAIFKEASRPENKPSIVYLDILDMEALTPKMVVLLVQILDCMLPEIDFNRMFVIAASDSADLPHQLRRPGRFDHEVYIGLPNEKDRVALLRDMLRDVRLAAEVKLEYLARATQSFTPADLKALITSAARHAIRRVYPRIHEASQTVLELSKRDFDWALKQVTPSILKEYKVEIPNTHWSMIGGLEFVKEKIRETMALPLKYPRYFQRVGVRGNKGLLLWGPPGTGKTTLAKAIATEVGANFIYVKATDIPASQAGEDRLDEIFQVARELSSAVLFFDEVESIAPRREKVEGTVQHRILNQFLVNLDGLTNGGNVITVAATNRPNMMDPAILRPGRFDQKVFLPPPDDKARREIFNVHLGKAPLSEDVELEELVRLTAPSERGHYSGADIEKICNEAAVVAAREAINNSTSEQLIKIQRKHLLSALGSHAPSISRDAMREYSEIAKTLEMPVFA